MKNKVLSILSFSLLTILYSCGGSSGGGAFDSRCGTTGKPACRIYHTEMFKGNLGGIAGADVKCNDTAGPNHPGDGIYKALVVGDKRRACTTANCSGGAKENKDWVFRPNRAYLNSDSDPIGTTTEASIFSFNLSNDLEGDDDYWTGLDTNWTTTSNCSDWTSSSNAVLATYGGHGSSSNQAISDGTYTCDAEYYILCVEQ